MSPAPNANIARHLALMASRQPTRAALKIPRGRTAAGEIDYLTLSFAELDAEVAAWSARLTAAGVGRGDRTLVMVRQGLPLIASAFALFRLGAVPVVIDPGMGLKSFLACVERSRPRALVGIPLARLVSRVFLRPFRSVAVRVAASGALAARLTAPGVPPRPSADMAPSAADDLAAILFTSGSTGVPKGVAYEHGMFDAQVRLIREAYAIEPGEIDLPMLPIFALFNPALGMTTVVPEIDPRRPASVDPAKIVQAIRQEGVTNSFGSPTLWRKIGDHCLAQGLELPSLRRVLCAGAPVPEALWASSRRFLPRGLLHSPYGATEALPVSTVSSADLPPATGLFGSLHAGAAAAPLPPGDPARSGVSEIADTTGGAEGSCVGRPLPGIEVRVVAPVDGPIAALADTVALAPGIVGEIIVRGPVVTKAYDLAPEATALAKIPGPDGSVWHRMGDCGYLAADGRLWFCGRKVERVVTRQGIFYTEPVERIFRAHPRAARCALVGVGEPGQLRPALVVEATLADSAQCRALARELRALAQTEAVTASIKLFYFHPKFPVDVRHNAKIHRLTLARWATRARGYESDPKR